MKRRNFLIGMLTSPLALLFAENKLKASVYDNFKWKYIWLNRRGFASFKLSKVTWFTSNGTKIEDVKKMAIDDYISRTGDIYGKNCVCFVNKMTEVVILSKWRG